MPDIDMCATQDCPLRETCYRSPASGTKPTPLRQSWAYYIWLVNVATGEAVCPDYSPVIRKDASDA